MKNRWNGTFILLSPFSASLDCNFMRMCFCRIKWLLLHKSGWLSSQRIMSLKGTHYDWPQVVELLWWRSITKVGDSTPSRSQVRTSASLRPLLARRLGVIKSVSLSGTWVTSKHFAFGLIVAQCSFSSPARNLVATYLVVVCIMILKRPHDEKHRVVERVRTGA